MMTTFVKIFVKRLSLLSSFIKSSMTTIFLIVGSIRDSRSLGKPSRNVRFGIVSIISLCAGWCIPWHQSMFCGAPSIISSPRSKIFLNKYVFPQQVGQAMTAPKGCFNLGSIVLNEWKGFCAHFIYYTTRIKSTNQCLRVYTCLLSMSKEWNEYPNQCTLFFYPSSVEI